MPATKTREQGGPSRGLGGRGAILARAHRLDEAHRRTMAMFATRPDTEDAWLAATKDLRAAWADWWEPVRHTASQIAEGDQAAVDEALDLLEADPWCFNSGYTKELLLRRIGSRSLTSRQQSRLLGVAQAWVEGRGRREFRAMARIAPRQIPAVRGWAVTRLAASDRRTRLHALWVVTYFPLKRISPDEATVIRSVLLDVCAADPDTWRHGDWMDQVMKAVATDEWAESLTSAALDGDSPSVSELRLLEYLPALPMTPARRHRLHQIVLSEAERESLNVNFEGLARMAADDDLLQAAESLAASDDPGVAIRAWWVVRQVLIAQGRFEAYRQNVPTLNDKGPDA